MLLKTGNFKDRGKNNPNYSTYFINYLRLSCVNQVKMFKEYFSVFFFPHVVALTCFYVTSLLKLTQKVTDWCSK